MMRRIFSLALIAWVLGFLWFAITLPQPLEDARTQAVVVPTGSGGRIERGLDLLRDGSAEKLLVTGVDSAVTPTEFAAEYDVEDALMECCVTLGFAALDTRGNARETTLWMEENGFTTMRLVTADWHMRRAELVIGQRLPGNVEVLRDAVHSEADLATLFIEYHKLIFAWLVEMA